MQSRPGASLLMMVVLGAASGTMAASKAASSQDGASLDGASLDDPPPKLNRDQVYALDASLERIVQDFAIPGLAIGIVENGQPVYVRGFGIRDTRSDQPVNAHTLFHVGSITRTFTATAVLQLAERRQLGLSDSIADSPVTLTQLLTREDAAFNALGSIVETASQHRYLQYMQTSVLDAAGLAECTLGAPLAGTNVAWPHTGRVLVRRAQHYPWKEDSIPSTGLSASISDMTRWAALHVTRDPSLLTMTSYDTMIQHQRDGERDGTGLAFGWQLERRGEEWLPRQVVRGQGFSALLTLYPEQQRAIVILSNGETTPSEQIRGMIESMLAGEAYMPPKPSLILRSDFRWAFGGLVAMSLLLVAVSIRYRRRRQPAS